jgi:hypothetical protein
VGEEVRKRKQERERERRRKGRKGKDREGSLKTAKIMRASKRAIPICCIISSFLKLKGEPLKSSMLKNKRCPPSKTGIGSKLRRNRLIEIIPMIFKSIKLKNIRSYREAKITFPDGAVVGLENSSISDSMIESKSKLINKIGLRIAVDRYGTVYTMDEGPLGIF